jgi:hypothetical protein
MKMLIRALKSEWLKQRRSGALTTACLGALFTPSILLAARLAHPAALSSIYRAPDFWSKFWSMAWDSVALIVLPIVVMLITSVLVQLEYRNNAWKQTHASPQPLAAIYVAKLLVILTIIGVFFVVFNLALYLVAVAPLLFFPQASYPVTPFPLAALIAMSLRYFIDILPIVALQYLLSLHFKSFLTPLGIGMAQLIVVLGCNSWKYICIFPSGCIVLDYLMTSKMRMSVYLPMSLQSLALCYFALFALVGVWMYATKTDRG